ncbi:MAG TPA: ABC transporter ATP-binding protein [Lachnospiraceae bacterium]|nr:ABC transporter ATP-binding protein [Lachnospiraceae bacterium]
MKNSFETGKMYAITGKSGSGKSTLLSLLAGLDTPAAGEIFIEGQSLKNIDRDEYRRKQASVVYQAFHLFPLLNAVENVMFPMELNGVKQTEAKLQAEELIKKVGLEAKIFRQFPKMMSGGEQQRIAIARAMASKGTILLADEPTGNLDSKNEELITALLKKLAYEEQYTVIVVTHNAAVSKKADIVYVMQDGELKGE